MQTGTLNTCVLYQHHTHRHMHTHTPFDRVETVYTEIKQYENKMFIVHTIYSLQLNLYLSFFGTSKHPSLFGLQIELSHSSIY